MRMFSDFTHRLHLRLSMGRDFWHQRFYRPSVNVVEGEDKIWLEEFGTVLEAAPASVLKGRFTGRCNVLLSGPSVKSIKNPRRISECDWIGVNGSPALFEDEIPRMRIYHVNDTGYIRNSVDDFAKFARFADYTVIDYRAAYLLLALGMHDLENANFVLFDGWAWPFRLPVGKIEELADSPRNGSVALSTDLRLGLAQGGTVAYTAAQLVWLGGYDSLYFYGLDLSDMGRFYEEQKAQPQMISRVFERMIVPAFELMGRESSKTGFQIKNCNPDSLLPDSVIPKIDGEESFGHRDTNPTE